MHPRLETPDTQDFAFDCIDWESLFSLDSMSIYQTVYVSSASFEFGATELRSLLEKSRRKNSELGRVKVNTET